MILEWKASASSFSGTTDREPYSTAHIMAGERLLVESATLVVSNYLGPYLTTRLAAWCCILSLISVMSSRS